MLRSGYESMFYGAVCNVDFLATAVVSSIINARKDDKWCV